LLKSKESCDISSSRRGFIKGSYGIAGIFTIETLSGVNNAFGEMIKTEDNPALIVAVSSIRTKSYGDWHTKVIEQKNEGKFKFPER